VGQHVPDRQRWCLRAAGRSRHARRGPAGRPAAGSDIAVPTGTAPPPPTSSVGLPVPDPTATPPHGQVALLNGSSGDRLDQDRGPPYPVLHAGPALTTALGVTTGDAGAGTTTVTEPLTLATYDSAGSQLASSSYSTSTPASTDPNHSTFGFGIAFPVGDLEPNSAVDGLALLFITSGNNRNSEQVLFHGVNGKALTDQKRAPHERHRQCVRRGGNPATRLLRRRPDHRTRPRHLTARRPCQQRTPTLDPHPATQRPHRRNRHPTQDNPCPPLHLTHVRTRPSRGQSLLLHVRRALPGAPRSALCMFCVASWVGAQGHGGRRRLPGP